MLNNSIYEFLLELRENNNRDWFHANKEKYDKAKKDFEFFIELVIEQLKTIDPNISGLQAKDCIYRIYRDTRFSNNKTPYKTNFGAFLSTGGRKSKYAGYFIQIEPERCFIGGGCYKPDSKTLKAIREEIFHVPTDFKTIIDDAEFTKQFSELYDDKLKTAPRGYAKDFEYINLLNYKSYVGTKSISDEIANSDRLSVEINQVFKALYPLNQFLNEIIADI